MTEAEPSPEGGSPHESGDSGPNSCPPRWRMCLEVRLRLGGDALHLQGLPRFPALGLTASGPLRAGAASAVGSASPPTSRLRAQDGHLRRVCLLSTTGGADAPGAVMALEWWAARPYESSFLLPFLSLRHLTREISSALSFRSEPSGSLTSTMCWCRKHCPGGLAGMPAPSQEEGFQSPQALEVPPGAQPSLPRIPEERACYL